MNKITAEEAKKALQRLSSVAYMNLEDTLLLDEYIYQTSKAPTFDDLQTQFTEEEIISVEECALKYNIEIKIDGVKI